MNDAFWRGKRVLLTGHTGFKGSWLFHWLGQLGAEVTGYSLPPATDPALFDVLAPWPGVDSVIGDVRDRQSLQSVVSSSQPEIVIHLAAQALVGESYADPVGTLSTNAIGTANVLDVLRGVAGLKVVLVVTSDKVYQEGAAGHRFVEEDRLGGASPYEASKVAQELVSATFARSYLDATGAAVATCRVGNVIGGGDWAADRLVPDYFRSLKADRPLELRNPEATRPWQHVLDPLGGYLTYAQHLYTQPELPRALNFGPGSGVIDVAGLVAKLDKASGRESEWTRPSGAGWSEQPHLALDSTAAHRSIGWQAHIDIDLAVDWTVQWNSAYEADEDMRTVTSAQIDAYMELVATKR